MASDGRPVSRAEELHRQAVEALSGGRLDEGMALLKKALGAAEGSPTASSIILNDLGMACWQKGQSAMAEHHYKKAVQLAPHNARALGNYGAFLVEQNRLAEAEPLIRQALAMMPEHYKIQNDAGRLQFKKNNLGTAERFYRASIHLNPHWANAHNNLGELLLDMNRPEESAQEYLAALKVSPQNIAAYNGLGKAYARLRRDDAAIEAFDAALTINPSLERSWERKLTILERTQRLDEAEETLKAALAACPGSGRLAVFEAKLLRRREKIPEAIALMERLRPSLEGVERTDQSFVWNFLFEMGELYDRVGDIDKSFACIARAKAGEAQEPKAQAYDKTALPRQLEQLKAGFTPAVAARPGVPVDRPAPVFLVGFPRSGTTLLDQILSSHPGIRVADERPAVDKIAQLIVDKYAASYPRPRGKPSGGGPLQPAGLVDFSGEDIPALRAAYYAAHDPALGNWNSVFVDKLPLNIVQAGLIARVFPGAKFILALRHPCDAVLSCYLRRFEFNPATVQFLDLGDTARLYDGVFGLWDHYNSVSKLAVHAVRYEDVVADFRPAVGGLLDFLGLPWSDAVLEYDKTAREKAHISTPSYHQVTQKIYTRASGRWHRYAKYLEPVLPVLAPWAEKLGYSMT